MKVLRALGVAVLILSAIVPPAIGAPGDREVSLITPSGTGAFDAFINDAGADGSRTIFSTPEPNGALGDTDASLDVFERAANGSLRLISFPGSGAFLGSYQGMSDDGSRIWFSTAEPNLDFSDNDASFDVYERSAGGALRLITVPGNFTADGLFRGNAADGSRVFFSTTESALGIDNDLGMADIYERSAGGVLRLISFPGAGAAGGFWGGASRDGTRVWFATTENAGGLGDADGHNDVYERAADGTLRRISFSGGVGPFVTDFSGATADGSRVWFTTDKPNPALGDNDLNPDVYERSSAGGLRLISTNEGTSGGAFFRGASPDGSRVWFATAGQVVEVGDTDTGADVFERDSDGSVHLMSTIGANIDAVFVGAAGDGSRVWYRTTEDNSALGDTDGAQDVYERSIDGTLRLVTPGTSADAATFRGASADGTRVWFSTAEKHPELGDTDTFVDVYERSSDGVLHLISAGNGAFDATFALATRDGSRVWYQTNEPNTALLDTDANLDVYEVRWAVPANLTAPKVTGVGRVGKTLTCAAGAWAGEGFAVTQQWLRNGVPIAGKTGATYRLVADDAGRRITCRESAANAIGTGTAASNAIRVAPFVQRRVKVAGASIVGTRLTCDKTGIRGATSSKTLWRRGSTTIGTKATYVVRAIDVGTGITCRVTAKNAVGTVASTSARRLIPTSCRVPALRGKPLALARELAGVAGCRTRVTRAAGAGVKAGAVLRTTPPAGTSLPSGSTITLVVRK